jgi:hypothetical protein
MSFFQRMFGDKKKRRPSVRRKASRTRPFRKEQSPEELPSGMRVSDTETRVVGKRRPNESQELKAKKKAVPAPKAAPKAPKTKMDAKKKTSPAPMMRREAVTAKGMPAEGQPKSIAQAKKMGKDTFIGKDGRKKAAVTKEELEASGYKTLREYLNAQKRSKKKAAPKKMKAGGTVRGAGIAKKGFRPPKMVTMKGS